MVLLIIRKVAAFSADESFQNRGAYHDFIWGNFDKIF